LVHGGGKLATELANRLDISQQMHEGRRITDADTLYVVTMVYAGWINKNIVAQLQARGVSGVGLCGADAALIPAVRRPVKTIDYGFVGDVLHDRINTNYLLQLLSAGQAPVIAPISADATGQLLNINADTIAQSLAIALAATGEAVQLIYSFDRAGVLRDVEQPDSLISSIDPATYELLKAEGAIHSGMIPKLDNAFAAVRQGVKKVVLGRAEQLPELLAGKAGTAIVG
jgi:acetylglutamate kinase